MELKIVDAAEYGLTEERAKQISEQFNPMLKKLEQLEVEYNEVLKENVESQKHQQRQKN